MKVPFVIVLAHQKGGVGKSTIASNISVELAKICDLSVIDLDMQKSLTYFNNIRSKLGLQSLDILNINSAEELKKSINQNKKVLLIDVGGFDSDLNRIAILGADLLITPVSDAGIELVGLLAFRNILREIKKHRPDLVASILLNKIHTQTNASLKGINEFITSNPEFKQMNAILRYRVDYKKAFDKGQSVVEVKNKATNEMKILIEEIINGNN
jgi:chromosome partitioning protein